MELEERPGIHPPWKKHVIEWSYYQLENKGFQNFTDRSKMDHKTGSAFVACKDGEEISHVSVRLNDEATVYLADLNAIDLAINYILENYIINAEIISDSRSVLQALSNPSNICPHIWKIKNKVKGNSCNIFFKWAKVHIGILGNEAADAYAKLGTTKE
ncbi:RNase H domain-containing protein [Caerostris darwini]|uniref:RNase H domain-containing protein n=1 Tax=Caerostris darwini TaxID=1538125 RepID=A0AAV4U1M2_9ARAC|nr:RNase H domain-containing protein [Caerostris darwini]